MLEHLNASAWSWACWITRNHFRIIGTINKPSEQIRWFGSAVSHRCPAVAPIPPLSDPTRAAALPTATTHTHTNILKVSVYYLFIYFCFIIKWHLLRCSAAPVPPRDQWWSAPARPPCSSDTWSPPAAPPALCSSSAPADEPPPASYATRSPVQVSEQKSWALWVWVN